MDLIKLLQEKEISASLRQSLLAQRIISIHSLKELQSDEIKKIQDEAETLVSHDAIIPIVFLIRTGGGHLDSGAKLARYISSLKNTIGICGPKVGSLGAILFLSCNEKIVSADSGLFFHPNCKSIRIYPDSTYESLEKEFREIHTELVAHEPNLYELFQEISHGQITANDARSMCRKRSIFYGQDIVAYKLADKIVETYEVGINPE